MSPTVPIVPIQSIQRRRRGRLLWLLGVLALCAAVAAPAAAQLPSAPSAASPGRPEAPVTVGGHCPTFSWSETPGAVGYELEISAVPSEGAGTEAPVWVDLPAGTLAWTAAGEACLLPGVRYSWRLRTLLASGSGAWSAPRELRAEAEGPSLGKARSLLAALGRERLSSDQLDELAGLGWEGAPTRPAGVVLPPVGGETTRTRTAPAPLVTPPSSGTIYLKGIDEIAVWAKGTGVSVWGETASATGEGIRGEVDQGEALESTIAIEGESAALAGIGVSGDATDDPGNNAFIPQGVTGETVDGIGVHGLATASSGATVGVYGRSASPDGRGVCAAAGSGSGGSFYGAWGESASPGGFDFYAGGSGMNYGSFTGSHEVRLDPSSPLPRPGMVMALTGRTETRRATDGSVDLSSTLPSVTLATRVADPAVAGVYLRSLELPAEHWVEDRSGRFAVINALGEGRVWVTDRNGAIRAGDLLTTSDVPGHAQRQDEPALGPHTLGKALESVDWETTTRTVTHGGRTFRAALIAVVYTSG